MGHYINNYSNLLVNIVELEKEKKGFITTKSSLKAENACLNKLAMEEEKKRVRAKDQEKELKCKLSKMKTWMSTIALESVRVYRASEECTQAKRDYASDFYLFGKDEFRANVALKYPTI